MEVRGRPKSCSLAGEEKRAPGKAEEEEGEVRGSWASRVVDDDAGDDADDDAGDDGEGLIGPIWGGSGP